MSSPKVIIKGTVKEVGDLDFVGPNKDVAKQRIIVFKPAPVNEDGETFGKPDYFAFDVIGNTVERLNINETYLNAKVECEVRFSGTSYRKLDDTIGYGLNANLVGITKIGEVAQHASAEATEKDDDLPF